MRIDKLSSVKQNAKLYKQENKSNPFNKQAFDSVSFTGLKPDSKNTALFKKLATRFGALALSVVTAVTGYSIGARKNSSAEVNQVSTSQQAQYQSAAPTEFPEILNTLSPTPAPTPTPTATATTAPTPTPTPTPTPSPSPSPASTMRSDLQFQLDQTQDTPSLTVDSTRNYEYDTIQPLTQKLRISDIQKYGYNFTTLGEMVDYNFGTTEQDVETRTLAMYATLKANPWMVSLYSDDVNRYENGDVTNIPYDTLANTDIVANNQNKVIFFPEITTLNENKYTDTGLVASTDFIALNANDNNVATLTIKIADVAGKKDGEILRFIESEIANAYGVRSMDSVAGIAIWHALGLHEPNENLFRYSDEDNLAQRLVSYVKDSFNDVQIELPRVPISVMNAGSAMTEADFRQMLIGQTNSNSQIAYIANDTPVVNYMFADEAQRTPIMMFQHYHFPDGTSLYDAYMENPEAHEALLLAGFRQIIDNNNNLYAQFGNRVVTVGDLFAPMDLAANDGRVNLQPLAYIKVERKVAVNKGEEQPQVTPTPTPTQEPTPTPTQKPTPTPTQKPTPTPTQKPTPTPSPSPSPTPTKAPTPSPSPSPCPTEEPQDTGEGEQQGGGQTEEVEGDSTPTPAPVVTPTPCPTEEPQDTEEGGDQGGGQTGEVESDSTPTPAPVVTPIPCTTGEPQDTEEGGDQGGGQGGEVEDDTTGGEVTGGEVTGGEVTGNDTTDGNATGGEVTGGEVTGGEVTGGEVTGGEVTGGEVTGGEVTGGEVTGGEVTGGEVTGGEVTGNDTTDGNATGGEATGNDTTDDNTTGGNATGGETAQQPEEQSETAESTQGIEIVVE